MSAFPVRFYQSTRVPSFVALDLQTSEKSRGGGAGFPPSGTRDFQSPVEIGLRLAHSKNPL